MKSRNLIDSFNYAIEGMLYALRTQRNIKIHFVMAVIVLAAAAFMDASRVEVILIFIVIAMVIAAEMLNTAIETVVNMVQKEYHPLAAIAKNVSAGAVLVTAINAVIVGYIVFFDKLNDVSLSIIKYVKSMPLHVSVISLAVVTIVVIMAKALSQTGTFLRGGMPSGHSALAMSLSTSITLLSGDALIGCLSLLMAILVLHSQVDAGIHTVWEVIIGGIFGVIVTLIIFQLFLF